MDIYQQPGNPTMKIKAIVGLLFLLASLILLERVNNPAPESNDRAVTFIDNQALLEAMASGKSDVQVRGGARVVRLLPDDLEGSRHQRFILQVAKGKTVLIAHNIDLAARIDSLRVGDRVDFFGEYEWNRKGGVVHWTHRDPAGRHVDGWLRHRGKTYQ